MIDRCSPPGQIYLNRKQNSLFYKQAKFYSVDETAEIIRGTGFDDFSFRQTVFKDMPEITDREIVSTGYGNGLFAVIHGEKMTKYDDITEARELLCLPERASMEEIKSNYRKLIMQWHPDKCIGNNEKCNEMTKKLTAAYKTIICYCNQYKYSFAKEEVEQYLSAEDWWFKRFGNDPLWGNINKS